jgi:hypothetical protein
MSNSPHTDHLASRPEFLVLLGLVPPLTVEDVKQAYLEKAKTAHPDHGGSAEQFVQLHKAFEQATEYARFKAGRMQWLSQWVEQYAEQEQVVGEVKALGGSVEVDSSEWLATSIGADFATVLDRLIAIRLAGRRIDDRVLVNLAARRRTAAALERLELIDTQVTSVGLGQLQYFESLRHLDLSGTRVSRRAVQSILHDLRRLESIVLRNTGIGWWSRLRLRFSRRGLAVSA